MIRWLSILILLLVPALVRGETVIHGIRTGENPGHTRVVVDLSAEPTWETFVLERPDRFVIDIQNADWKLKARPDPARGLLTGLRYGRYATDTGRIVLETAGPVTALRTFLLPPRPGHDYRLVIDLKPADKPAAPAETRLATVASVLTKPPPPPPPRPDRVRTVIIDPGHGGNDPGAISRGRKVREKEVVLAVGKALRDALTRTGRYRVVMTRDRDRFVSLRDRVRIARRAGGELFVSLHADAAAGRNVRGAGIYTLSEKASDREAAALARRENQSDIIAGVDLTQSDDAVTNLILIDLVQRETMNSSARFARVAVREIGKTIRLRRNPHRFAGFRVLRAPDIPSVLVELGFLSNAEEEKKLTSKAWQKRVSAALVAAIDAYFKASAQQG